MAYIYQITNDINGKIYIGKTEFSIEKRWKEHCEDAYRREKEKRPLYAAMRKYGINHFHIDLIEETDSPEEREIYWIEQKQSFKNGYNATMGGDGRKFLDYDLIISTYRQLENIAMTAKALGIDKGSVHKVLTANIYWNNLLNCNSRIEPCICRSSVMVAQLTSSISLTGKNNRIPGKRPFQKKEDM